MHALIDGDIFLYEFGSAKQDNGQPLQWPFVISRMDARIRNILEAVNATSKTIYLTGKGNFREEVATIKPYKGNRPSDKPYWHQHIIDFLLCHRNAVLVEGMEADDAVAIEQCKRNATNNFFGNGDETYYTVICSRDKDLHMIPGYHYTWPAGKQKEKGLWWQDETNALRCFYRQLLTGDPVDNIPGLYGVGKSSRLCSAVDECDSELEMFQVVAEAYRLRFGSYWSQFMSENGTLLWIKREPPEDIDDVGLGKIYEAMYSYEYETRFADLEYQMSRTQTEEG